ncbi:MAG: fumarylacetoacetate hydrolase [Planctomycetes bacterium]|nr:fumarylacetoacetate hydrolase [Planctomycetota bacterium]
MKLCRFSNAFGPPRVGLLHDEGHVHDLTEVGATSLTALLDDKAPHDAIAKLASSTTTIVPAAAVRLLPPVEHQEVWAAGVTYLRSKKARMAESTFSKNAYDMVYEAARPEIFFKAMPHKVVGPQDLIGIRSDARWNVPEPELALVFNARQELVGCTIGNDMSSRDIEGENLLYLPQAKIYRNSCALGPCITLATEQQARAWQIAIRIDRAGAAVFAGTTSVSQIKRSFTELADFLFRSQQFPFGVVLLTGTGIVPPESFTLAQGDVVTITIDGIGTLQNTVARV